MTEQGSGLSEEGSGRIESEGSGGPAAVTQGGGSTGIGDEEKAPAPGKPKGPGKGRRAADWMPGTPRLVVSPAQRLLILDAWLRSSMPAKSFAPIVGVSAHTLYSWKKRFEADGPAGLEDGTRGAPKGIKLPEPTQRAIVMLKSTHPDWGVDRIRDVLLRSEGYGASSGAIQQIGRAVV